MRSSTREDHPNNTLRSEKTTDLRRCKRESKHPHLAPWSLSRDLSLSLRCDKCSLECAAPARNVKIRLVALRQARPQPAWQTYWETEGERGNSRESRITVEDVNGRRWMSCGSELEWKTRKHRVGSGKLKVRSRCDRRGTGWFVGWKMMLYGLIFFTIRKMQI